MENIEKQEIQFGSNLTLQKICSAAITFGVGAGTSSVCDANPDSLCAEKWLDGTDFFGLGVGVGFCPLFWSWVCPLEASPATSGVPAPTKIPKQAERNDKKNQKLFLEDRLNLFLKKRTVVRDEGAGGSLVLLLITINPEFFLKSAKLISKKKSTKNHPETWVSEVVREGVSGGLAPFPTDLEKFTCPNSGIIFVDFFLQISEIWRIDPPLPFHCRCCSPFNIDFQFFGTPGIVDRRIESLRKDQQRGDTAGRFMVRDNLQPAETWPKNVDKNLKTEINAEESDSLPPPPPGKTSGMPVSSSPGGRKACVAPIPPSSSPINCFSEPFFDRKKIIDQTCMVTGPVTFVVLIRRLNCMPA